MAYKIRELCNKHDMTSDKGCLNNFCKTCATPVNDLHGLDNNSLLKAIANTLNTCVNIRPSQLRFLNKNNNFPKIKTALLTLSLAVMTTSCSKKVVQDFVDGGGQVSIHERNEPAEKKGSHFIKGQLIEQYSKEPMIGVMVQIKNTEHSVITDIDGNFEMEIPNTFSENQIIEFYFIGYWPLEIEIEKILNKDILVELGEGPMIGYLELIK